MWVEVRPPITRLAAQRPFNRKTGQQTMASTMANAKRNPNRLRQPNVLTFSTGARWCLVNLCEKHLFEIVEARRRHKRGYYFFLPAI